MNTRKGHATSEHGPLLLLNEQPLEIQGRTAFAQYFELSGEPATLRMLLMGKGSCKIRILVAPAGGGPAVSRLEEAYRNLWEGLQSEYEPA